MEIIQLQDYCTQAVGRGMLMLLLFHRSCSISIKKIKSQQILKLVYLEITKMNKILIRKIVERVDSK